MTSSGLGDQLDAVDGEAEPGTELTQQVDRSGAAVPEPEVLPHHDIGGVQPVDDDVMDEFLGTDLGQRGGERQHQEGVHPEFGDQLGPAAQRGQQGRVAARPDHLGRMRIERHQHRRQAVRPTGRDGLPDQRLMPTMHAVEHADGQHATSPARRDLVDAAPVLHQSSCKILDTCFSVGDRLP